MRNFIFTFTFLLAGLITNAQSFGIKGGINFASLSGDGADGLDGITSFHIGGIAEFKIFENLALQPELLYSTQGAKIDDTEYKLGYLTLPVMAKFYLNDKLSIHVGPQFGVLVSETSDVMADDSNTFDFGLAGGIEYRIAGGLFAQARYNAGMSELSENADVKNSVFQLSIGYLF